MRADRLISLLMILQNRGQVSAADLAAELEVSERTVYRDLEALSLAGVPVYARPGPGGGCALLESYRTSLTGLTNDELQALFMLGIPEPLVRLGINQELKSALRKLSASLTGERRKQAEFISQRFYLDSGKWWQPPQETLSCLETIQAAVEQDRKLSILYKRSGGEPQPRTIEPYALVAKENIWYLVRRVNEKMGVYRVSRIIEAHMQEDRFQRQPGFNLAAYWSDWCREFETSRPNITILVRASPEFLADMPRYANQKELAYLQTAPPPDAQGWREVKLYFETSELAFKEIIQWGCRVEVLEPLELRQAIIEYTRQIYKFYAQEKSPLAPPANGAMLK